MNLNEMYQKMGIDKDVYTYGQKIAEELKERFAAIDETAEYNQLKVLHAMQKNRVSDIHFAATSGYGYNDLGRDTLEDVYADTFHAEAGLVRPQITCGTHALAVALAANLRPGDELLAVSGKPYDTLEEVIGIRPSNGSLAEYGITYQQVDLKADSSFDLDGHPRSHQRENENGTHSAFQRLSDQKDIVCDGDRRGYCICQIHQTGCNLHGRQLLW